LTRHQAEKLINAPAADTLKGIRDRAVRANVRDPNCVGSSRAQFFHPGVNPVNSISSMAN
jgi:hypothetical protein